MDEPMKADKTNNKPAKRAQNASHSDAVETRDHADELESEELICGLIMPISSIDNCSEQHWAEVKNILSEALVSEGFSPRLVSESEDIGVIQRRIVQNLYDDPVVVCDVSGKNANVMFELGLRLAFDKPTIIVKDDKTNYSFDTSPVEHLEYPRSLRYADINKFKSDLSRKVKATYEKSVVDPEYSTFLKHFGKFEVSGLKTESLSESAFFEKRFDQLEGTMQRFIGHREASSETIEALNEAITLNSDKRRLRLKRRVSNSYRPHGILEEYEVRASRGEVGTSKEEVELFVEQRVSRLFPPGSPEAYDLVQEAKEMILNGAKPKL